MKLNWSGHFIVIWLGLFSSPEVLQLAYHWKEYHPGGMWDYR